MNFIKKMLNKRKPKTTEATAELKLGGHDIDDKVDTTILEEVTVVNAGPPVNESAPKKKPGRPKGSSTKKTPAKKTPSKKTPSKKI